MADLYMGNSRNDENLRFMKAVREGRIEDAKSLITQGADVDVRGENGGTALMIAAVQGNLRLVQMLLDAGANPNLKDTSVEDTALIHAARYNWRPEAREIIEALINAGADPSVINGAGSDVFSYISTFMPMPDFPKVVRRRKQSNTYIHYLLNEGYALEELPAMMKNTEARKDLVIHAAQQGRFDVITQLMGPKGDEVSFLKNQWVCEIVIKNLENGAYSVPFTRLKILKKITALHSTLRNSNLEQLEKRLTDNPQEKKHHAIVKAIETGDFLALDVLIKEYPGMLNVKDRYGRTLLDIAYSCYVLSSKDSFAEQMALFQEDKKDSPSEERVQSHREIFFYILARSDVNLRTCHNQTILHHAVTQEASLPIITLLLLSNADLNAKDAAKPPKRPVDYLKNEEEVHHKNLLVQGLPYLVRPENTKLLEMILGKILPTLKNESLKEEYLTTLLVEAVKSKNIDLVKNLLLKGANAKGSNKAGINPFTLAAKEGQIDMVDLFLEAGVDVNVEDTSRDTALGNAACYGQANMVRHLLAKGANPNIKDSFEMTALARAVKYNHLGIVQDLLARNANPNMANNLGDTALHIAARFGRVEMVKDLLAHGADPNVVSHSGCTPLLLVAQIGNREIADALISAGADIDFQNATNDGSALGIAACYGKTETVNYLLNRGADPNLTDKYGWTALMEAVKIKNTEMVQSMLGHGADPTIKDKSGRTARSMAGVNTIFNLIYPVYTQRQEARSFFSFFKTKTMSASSVLKVRQGNFSSLEHLVKTTPKIVDMKDDKGNYLLHMAYTRRLISLEKHPESKEVKEDKDGQRIFSLLLEKSNINLKNKDKQSLLHMAAKNKAPLTDLVLLLLKGANLQDRDREGNMASHYIPNEMEHHKQLLTKGIQYLVENKDQEWVKKIFNECPDDVVKYEALLRLRNMQEKSIRPR